MSTESQPTENEKGLVQLGSMYANAVLALATVRDAASDVLKAVVPHPKFRAKTRLVWVAELENLEAILANTAIPGASSDVLDLLRKHRVPSFEQAQQMAVWLRGMMRLSEPEQIELRAKLEKLGHGEDAA